MFPSSSFVNPTPPAHADTPRDNDPRRGLAQLRNLFIEDLNSTKETCFKCHSLQRWTKDRCTCLNKSGALMNSAEATKIRAMRSSAVAPDVSATSNFRKLQKKKSKGLRSMELGS
ncbi:hypothetical protein TNCV_2763691 [Trichonephila clavipes]|nr:hypothetical protein TNCV_2763691 [Trichonephila clavipes]